VNATYPRLFEPITINGLELKNRLVMPPMCTRMATPRGEVTAQQVEYYRRRARGGVALIIVEYAHIDQKCSKSAVSQLGAYSDLLIPGLNELAEAIQSQGAKACLQICHGGRQTNPAHLGGALPIGPSAVPCEFTSNLIGAPNTVREATVEELREIAASFAEAAVRAKSAGFDAVELHGAHGYLLCSFVSPRSNKRTDAYGGDIRQRATYPLEVVREVRNALGPDFPLFYRMSGDELLPDGITLKEGAVLAGLLQQAGVDCIHVSGSNFESMNQQSSPIYMEPGHLVPLAEGIKNVVSVPVIAVGALNEPGLAEDVLESGKADLIAIGRQLLADPDLPRKAESGRAAQIRPCIRCNEGCMGRFFLGRTQRCSINYETGRELDPRLRVPVSPGEQTGHMVVVGGGVAGMEAARVGRLLGFDVTLLEKEAKLGGNVAAAAIPSFKKDLRRLLEWYEFTLEEQGVRVELQKEATEDVVAELSPDLLFLAVGAEALRPPLPGVDLAHVTTAVDVYFEDLPLPDPVVVCGGGMMGCEAAVHLASQGKRVKLLEMIPLVASDLDPVSRLEMMEMLADDKIEVLTNTKVVGISDEAVVGSSDDGTRSIPAASVVLALSMQPRRHIVARLTPLAPVVLSAGDCVRPGRIGDAIQDAASKMLNLRRLEVL